MKRLILSAWTFLTAVGLLLSVQPRKLTLADNDDFLKGRFNGVALSSEGVLSLAPAEEALFGPDEEFYLSLVEAQDGTLFLGTGHAGKIFRLPKGGQPEVYFQTAEIDVTCLALDSRGVLFAGTSPGGKIYKITAKDTGESFFNPDEKYIWDLVFAEGGKMLAAVGESGAIYEISAEGDGRRLFKASETHVICLALEPGGDVLAGSAGNGLLYRVTRAGKATALFDPSCAEVKAIARDAKGGIYLAACGERTPAAKVEPSKSAAAKEADEVDAGASDQKVSVAVTASAASPSLSAALSAVYRLDGEGRSRKLWGSEDELVYDLAWDEARQLVLFGTGDKGRLYAADLMGQSFMLAQKSSEQVSALCPVGGRLHLLSNNPARLDVLLPGQRTEGEYVSSVFDARTASSWGRFVWQGESPAGTTLQFQTRSGNTLEPSPAWSEWSPPYHKSEGEQVLSPKARYLQWRALFRVATGRLAPRLNQVDVYYLQANLSPRLTRLESLPPNVVYIEPRLGDDRIVGSPRYQPSDVAEKPIPPDSQTKKDKRKGYRTFVWEAEDENEDTMSYSLFVRREGEGFWRLLEKDWVETVYAIDTVTLPDGRYHFKVAVSDKLSNPGALELQGEKISRSLTVDNTAPLIRNATVSKEAGKLKVSLQAEDSLSPLVEARVLLRPSPWVTLFPSDGICDSLKEEFSFTLDLSPGSDDMLTVIVLDAHGNTGVFRQSFPR